jgi:ADP-ribosylglycohydrolase
MFLRGPNDFKTILETINAGGDNDTNGKFVGEMLGAYHGIEFFQNEKWACEGLRDYQKILDLTDKFCDTFGIK